MDFRYYVAFISEWLGAFGTSWLLSFSPRFRSPTVGFVYARRDGLVALSAYVLILVFAFFFYANTTPVFPEPLRMAPAPVHALAQALLVAGVALLVYVAALVLRKQPVRSIGWNPALLKPGLQMGFAIAVLTVFLRNQVMNIFAGLPSERLYPLLLALPLAIAEETIFRGYIQMRLAWWLKPAPGIILTAALFALWHLPPWIDRLPTQTILTLLALTFVQGLVQGWIMHKSGHVAAPALYRAFAIWMQYLA